jgi:anti-sigma regulatory factor (Ser/Thr protein kinase)
MCQQLGHTKRSREIRQALITAIKEGISGFIDETAHRFEISRQSVHRHMTWLLEHDFLVAEGHAGRRTYRLGAVRDWEQEYARESVDEDVIYRRDFGFMFEGLPENIQGICHYGLTEIVNNARDHSDGHTVCVHVERNRTKIGIDVCDDGEGIFKRITRIMQLGDPREAILELHKGKLTTDPENHTGEGIFFCKWMFDEFAIASGDLAFVKFDETNQNGQSRILLHDEDEELGTFVSMRIPIDNTRTVQQVINEFATGNDYQFDKTLVPVRLALYEGDQLVSRSQAQRLLSRVERFRIAILDFEGVTEVGRSFIDEAFRVFPRRHPEIQLNAINASNAIERMIAAKRKQLTEEMQEKSA